MEVVFSPSITVSRDSPGGLLNRTNTVNQVLVFYGGLVTTRVYGPTLLMSFLLCGITSDSVSTENSFYYREFCFIVCVFRVKWKWFMRRGNSVTVTISRSFLHRFVCQSVIIEWWLEFLSYNNYPEMIPKIVNTRFTSVKIKKRKNYVTHL